MPLDFSRKIESVDTIEYSEFQERFMKPQIPVKIKHLLSDSVANKVWSPDYFKNKLGHVEVGVFANDPCYLDRSLKEAPTKMKFSEYLELLEAGPCDARLHLFNVFKYAPETRKDFKIPDITDKILKTMALTFFGGEGTVARMHRDMDNSNVFLSEFWGRKKIVLFSPKYDKLLYRYPFTTHTGVDIENPDYDKFPGLHDVRGMHTILGKGETLFMPSRYWHFVRYLSTGIGMAFRSLGGVNNMVSAAWQMGVISQFDDGMRQVTGDWWFNKKQEWAIENAQKIIRKQA